LYLFVEVDWIIFQSGVELDGIVIQSGVEMCSSDQKHMEEGFLALLKMW
jgi:hypothetical protein